MVKRKEYSAGAVKVCFWFSEFRKVVSLLNEGNSIEDVKMFNQRENIFSASTVLRANQIFSTVRDGICEGYSLLEDCMANRCRFVNKVLTGRFDKTCECMCWMENIWYEMSKNYSSKRL